jgi:hypothetical protein
MTNETIKIDIEAQAAVERLWRSKEESDAASRDEGRERGREWAMNRAGFTELKQLSHILGQCGGRSDSLVNQLDEPGYAQYEALFFTIRPDEQGQRWAAIDFWKAILGIDPTVMDGRLRVLYVPSFLQGFVEGALAFWDEVKDQM